MARVACAGGQWSQRGKLTAKQSADLAPLTNTDRFFELAEEGVLGALNASYHDGAGAAKSTGVKHWVRFTTVGLRQAAIRLLDPSAPISAKLAEEDLIMRFGWWLVTQVGVSVETAEKYVSTVLAWHKRWQGVGIAGDLEMHRLKQLWKGLERKYNTGYAKTREDKRWGVRPQFLAKALAKAEALAAHDYASVLHANYSAAAQCAFAGLLRGAEVCPPRFDPETEVTRADVIFRHGHVILYCRNTKAKGKDRMRKLPIYLPAGGSLIDPVAALRRLFEVDPVPKHLWRITPLFRDPATNNSLAVSQLRSVLRVWLSGVGLPGPMYGAHSLRIGGATAFFEAGGDKLEIQTQGRWDSDAYLAYLRAAQGRGLAMSLRACSLEVNDHAQHFVDIDIEPESD